MAQNSDSKPKKRGPGRPFPKGVSGNPGGAPKELVHVRDLARTKTEAAINTLEQIMQIGTSDAARVAAASALLDRAWGKPGQAIELSGPEGGPVAHAWDLKKLSSDELAAVYTLAKKAATEGNQ